MNLKKQFLADWDYTRSNTLKFIESIPNNKLDFSPNKNFGSLGRQLRHLADVQGCYIKALDTRKVTFQNKKKDYSLENDKQKLINYFNDLDKEMKNKLKRLKEKDLLKKVDWKEVGNPNMISMLNYMKEHEIYHQGILQLYAELAGFKTLRFY